MASLAPIENRIFHIRGQSVMLDRDLTALYGVSTKVLKQAVKRNIERFPPDFMLELGLEELKCSRSQFVTLKPSSTASVHDAAILDRSEIFLIKTKSPRRTKQRGFGEVRS
jgi:hypothetical protein